MQTIWRGQPGGWPGYFGDMVGHIRGMEFDTIDSTSTTDLGSWRTASIGGLGESEEQA